MLRDRMIEEETKKESELLAILGKKIRFAINNGSALIPQEGILLDAPKGIIKDGRTKYIFAYIDKNLEQRGTNLLIKYYSLFLDQLERISENFDGTASITMHKEINQGVGGGFLCDPNEIKEAYQKFCAHKLVSVDDLRKYSQKIEIPLIKILDPDFCG